MAPYGASDAAWQRFIDLGLTADLLPCVANPNAVIAARSTMQKVGKTPSIYDAHGEVLGLGKWTQRVSSAADVGRWRRQPDYAICIQTRTIRAFDIDVPDPAKADAIERAIASALDGLALPVRSRADSGKRLLGFRFSAPMPKRVIPVDGGIVEFLGDGQQFVAAGRHEAGADYVWDAGGLPREFPEIDEAQLEAVWKRLVMLFATGDPKIAREKRGGDQEITVDPSTDEHAAWLTQHWEMYGTGPDGELYLRCPFDAEHTTDSGISSTAYFLAGTGGFAKGHWKCLHAHCMDRGEDEFRHATGYTVSAFDALPEPVLPQTRAPFDRYHLPAIDIAALPFGMPNVTRNSQGKIDTTADNITKLLLRPDVVRMRLGLDGFREEIMWAPAEDEIGTERWHTFLDADYTRLRIILERVGVKDIGVDMLRSTVHLVASVNRFDSAQEWLSRLQWDGRPRVARFMADYMGALDRDYATAVSRYIWTALAGRVIEPGCQADMVPIFYGAQGARKTSAVKAMAPSGDFYVDITLSDRDDDLARRLRGKLIGELEELRGLRSRDNEAIKAWITRTHEEWVPKYKEFGTKFARRLLLIATTNMDEILGDETGERRWLPDAVGVASAIDVDAIARDRDQLWAEGAVMHRLVGVDYADAERLARDEHGAYKSDDPWSETVLAWLEEPNDLSGKTPIEAGVSANEILRGALGRATGDIDHKAKIRLNALMKSMGYSQKRSSRSRVWSR